jgi:hypothetical protein
MQSLAIIFIQERQINEFPFSDLSMKFLDQFLRVTKTVAKAIS